MCKIRVQIIFIKNPETFWTPTKKLLCFYNSVIRSVVEYGCVVWHHNLTTAQNDRLEALQKCALHIILYPVTLPYSTALAYCDIQCLKLRQLNFQQKLFQQLVILAAWSPTWTWPFCLPDCSIPQFTPSSGPNKTVLLLHKLLVMVLPVTTLCS